MGRVLVLIQVGSAAPRPDKHTPLQNNKAERKARAKRSRPLNRSGELPLLRSLEFFLVYCLIVFCLSQCFVRTLRTLLFRGRRLA